MPDVRVKLVRFAARDPGAANVLASFLRKWRPQISIEIDIWALPRAAAVLKSVGLPLREFPERVDKPDLIRAWNEHPAQVLVTGTSHYAPFEPFLWELSNEHGCPTLALIDYWSNLKRRFAFGKPDAVGAIDEWQAQELVELGFPPEQIIVVGQPWLSQLIGEKKYTDFELPPLTEDVTSVRVLFVSEPISTDVQDGHNDAYGFDEFDAFSLLYSAVTRVNEEGINAQIAVKFHPYENPENFYKRTCDLESGSEIPVHYINKNDSPHRWVLWANLVVGIGSVLLLEALILGKPVISLQPGLLGNDKFIASRLGFAPVLTNADKSEKFLAALITNGENREALQARQLPFVHMISTDRTIQISNWIENNVRTSVHA